MTAALTDKLQLVASAGSITTLAAPGKAIGASSINITSASGWPTTTGLTFAIRTVDATGALIPGTYTEWVGTLSGTTLSMGSSPSPKVGTDQMYVAGATTQVYIPVSSWSYNLLISALLATLNQDGTLQSGIVTSSKIATGAVTSTQVAAGGISFANLLSTIFSGQVQSQTNAGTAGGTMFYVNLGGIKILWMTTASQNSHGQQPYSVIFPTFFSTVQAAPVGLGAVGTDIAQSVTWQTLPSTTGGTLYFDSLTNSIGATLAATLIVIGT